MHTTAPRKMAEDPIQKKYEPAPDRHVDQNHMARHATGDLYRMAIGMSQTDIDARLLERARTGCYRWSSLKELPEELLAEGFIRRAAATP